MPGAVAVEPLLGLPLRGSRQYLSLQSEAEGVEEALSLAALGLGIKIITQ